MKLTIELFRWPDEMATPMHKRGRLSLLIRTDLPRQYHIELTSDEEERFTLDELRGLVDLLARRARDA